MKKISFLLFAFVISITAFTQTYNVTFEVTVPEGIPNQGRKIFIAGDLPPVTNWEKPGTNANLQMSLKQGTVDVYTITLQLNADSIHFKFFQATTTTPDWNAGEWPGVVNRNALVSGNCVITAIWGNSNSTVVTPIVALSEIKNYSFVYPSITSDYINVRDAGKIQIIDLCGKTVLSQNSVVGQALNISNLQSGIYLVKLENKQGIKVQKIFKQ